MKIDMRRYGDHTTADELAVAITQDTAPYVEGIKLLRNRLLVATYVRPQRSKGGIIYADRSLDEDKWQGKVGLLLKIGPCAFEFPEDDEKREAGVIVSGAFPCAGDWVFYRASDTWDFGLMPGVHCRIITDDAVIGTVADPSVIY